MMNRTSLKLTQIQITDPLWAERIRIARDVSIQYMWDALNDNIPGVPPSHSIMNMKIAAGLEQGEYAGRPFQDSDLYKWIEAASYAVQQQDDSSLRKKLDEAVGLIEMAQEPDGYINTYTKLTNTPHWENLANLHELYCAGHMMEAAVAYQEATGSDRLVKVACRFADLADSVFGREPGKRRGYPGHQEIEIGLYKLYKATGEKRYLDLAKYFLDERGQQPYYYDQEQEARIQRGESPLSYYQDHGPMRFSYQQAHLPVREQTEATGHAVRMVYMCTAMADVGRECDESLLEAADRLYESITDRQMYLIGAIGSMVDGEALSIPYDIPNDRMYTETCASIGLMMLSQRLLNAYGKARYADVIERALYNTVLASTSADGTRYFYTNPMEMWPERSRKRNDMKDIYPERQGWYVCACCPPNILRTLMSLGQYIYSADETGLFVNLYIGSSVRLHAGEIPFDLVQENTYMTDGHVRFTFHIPGNESRIRYALYLRWPYWCREMKLEINGTEQKTTPTVRDGYIVLDREFVDGDVVDLHFSEAPEYVFCDDRVPYNAGKVSIQYGPVVYCTEEADNGDKLWNLFVNTDTAPEKCNLPGLPEDMICFQTLGMREESRPAGQGLYTTERPVRKPASIKFIPYYYWGNRHPGQEMNIWHLADL